MLGSVLFLLATLFCGDSLDRVYSGEFAPNRPPDSAAIKIVDWNIHEGKRLDQLVAALRRQNADLILLQEVDQNVRRSGGRDIPAEIARRLGLNYVFAPAFEELGQAASTDRPGLQGQVTLARWKLNRTRVLRFERQTAFWQPQPWIPNVPLLQRRTGGRVALVTEFEVGRRTIVVYNLHLESRGFGYSRTLQLEEALRDAGRYPPATPLVLAGDFNSVYGPARLVDRLRQAGFRSCLGDRAVRTHVVIGALDWVFVRGLECGQASVVRGTGASDHDALSARLSWFGN